MDFTVKIIKGLNVFIYKNGTIEINSKKYIGYSTKESKMAIILTCLK